MKPSTSTSQDEWVVASFPHPPPPTSSLPYPPLEESKEDNRHATLTPPPNPHKKKSRSFLHRLIIPSSSSSSPPPSASNQQPLSPLSARSSSSSSSFSSQSSPSPQHPPTNPPSSPYPSHSPTSSSSSSSPSHPFPPSADLLHFEADDIIRVLRKDVDPAQPGWWWGEVVGLPPSSSTPGRFPASFTRAVTAPPPTHPPPHPSLTSTAGVSPLTSSAGPLSSSLPPFSSSLSPSAPSPLDDSTGTDGGSRQSKLVDLIRSTVSKKKRRYQRDGYDLDLSYITPQIIAMGFPSESLEGLYRNHMKDVQDFLTSRHGSEFKVYNLCFDASVLVWMADGTTKRVDQLLPGDQLLDELGQAINIVPNTLIGTVGFPQPLPLLPNGAVNPLAAAGALVPTPGGGPNAFTRNPGHLAKRRISSAVAGFEEFIVSDTHPLTVGTDVPAHRGHGQPGRVRRAMAYHYPWDTNWQVGQAPAALVGQPIWGHVNTTRLHGGVVSIRPYYWDGGLDPFTNQPYMGGAANGNYRDPRAGPLPAGGWPNWLAAQTAQVADWNAIHQLPAAFRLGEYPVNVIEAMPPGIRGRQTGRQRAGVLTLVKLSVPIVFPVNNYLAQMLDLAMFDAGLATGVVAGVNYALHAHPRVFFRAAQLERALRLAAVGPPAVYAFNDAAAVAGRAVMAEGNYRDNSPNANVVNPNPYQAIDPPTAAAVTATFNAQGQPAAVEELAAYLLEVTAWVVGLWVTDGGSAGHHIGQSLRTEYGVNHGVMNDHSGVFEKCQHWNDLLGRPAHHFTRVPAGLGHGVNQLPHTLLTFHVPPPPGGAVGLTNVLHNLLVRCGVVVPPVYPPGLTQAQRVAHMHAANALNKPRFWDPLLPNRMGWQNETVRTRRAFLAGVIDGDGSHNVANDQYKVVQDAAYAPFVLWLSTLFRQLGFRTGRPAAAINNTMLLQNIEHHYTDQRLLPLAIQHKRTADVGLRNSGPHKSTFHIDLDDGQGNLLAVGPVVSFQVQGGTGTGRLLLADGTITHNCSERAYPSDRFPHTARYPFDDHQPSPVDLIEQFCVDAHAWLSASPQRVIVLHCKAGKGRTGFMIACYLLYCGRFSEAEEALRFYAIRRTTNAKGVTIPSQIRFTHYFQKMLAKHTIQPPLQQQAATHCSTTPLPSPAPLLPSNPVLLLAIKLHGLPRALQTRELSFTIKQADSSYSSSKSKSAITCVRSSPPISSPSITTSTSSSSSNLPSSTTPTLTLVSSSSNRGISAMQGDVQLAMYAEGRFDAVKLFQWLVSTRASWVRRWRG